MKKNVFILVLLIQFFLGFSVFAQENFTLKDCIDYSLKNHRSNTIYNNEVRIANKRAIEAASVFLPQVNGSVSVDDNIKRQTTVIPAGAFSREDMKVQFGNQYLTNAVLQADQVIYDQAMIYGLKATQPNKEIAQLGKAKNEENLIYNTSRAYYQAISYKEQEKLLAENEKKFSELLNIMKLQYEKGVIKKIDYDRVRVNLNNIKSQRKLVQTNLDLALNRLKNAIGMPQESDIKIADSINYKQDIKLPEMTNTDDVKKRLDYKMLEQNVSLYQIDLRRKQAGFLPTLSVYGRYGAQAFGNDFEKSMNNWFDYSAVGMKLNVPIFSGLRRVSQVNQSELSLLNARENQKLTLENLNLELQNSNTQLLSSYTNLQSNKENLALAKDVFDNTSLQYQKGVAVLTDLLNADYSYKEAQTNYINSLLNVLTARIDFEKSKGTLKDYINQL